MLNLLDDQVNLLDTPAALQQKAWFKNMMFWLTVILCVNMNVILKAAILKAYST